MMGQHTGATGIRRSSFSLFGLLAMVAGAFGILSLTADTASAEEWISKVLQQMKAAEQTVQRSSVRVASLGGDYSASESTPRAKRAAISDSDRPKSRGSSNTRVASLGNRRSDADSTPSRPRRSLSGGSINWIASSGCLDGTLRSVINSLASNYGPLTVNSTCRSSGHNRRVGGAPKSLHLSGDAADFRIHSNVSAAYASLRSNGSVGGLKHYGGGLFHIDNGARRSW